MSNWIKHENGKPCPAPYKWIKKVKDAAGWEFARGEKGCLDSRGEYVPSTGYDWSARIDDEMYWTGGTLTRFTHFKLKKKYRAKWESMTPFEKFCLREGYDKNGPFVLKRDTAFWKEGTELSLKSDNGSSCPLMVTGGSTLLYVHTANLTQLPAEENNTPAKIEQEDTTYRCSDTGRTITLPQHLYEKHKEVVNHWLRGGEVERGLFGYWADTNLEYFLDTHQYRIKEKRPSPGEVWEVDCGTEDGDENYRPVVWITVDGVLRAYYFEDAHKCNEDDVAQPEADWPKRFLFNSIEEYYKQKVS